MSTKLEEYKKWAAVLELVDGKITVKEYDTVSYNPKTNKYRVFYKGYSVYCGETLDFEIGKYCLLLNSDLLPDACLFYAQSKLEKVEKDISTYEGYISKCNKRGDLLKDIISTLGNEL